MNFAARVPTAPEFGKNVLVLDAAAEVERIVEELHQQVFGELGRRGAVVGLSGGIDSFVVAALCVRAFGNRGWASSCPSTTRRTMPGLFRTLRGPARHQHRAGRRAPSALEGLGAYRRQSKRIRYRRSRI